MDKLTVAILLLTVAGQLSAQDPIKGTKPKPQPPSNATVTVFECVPFNGKYATIARRGDRVTPPMIEWTTTLGGEWTPQRRCQEVSQRLTRAVAASGGKLRNLQLTYGSVKGRRVICYIDASTPVNACNERNLLFTLRPEDIGKEREILQTIVQFSLTGTGNRVQQSAGQDYALLGDAVEDILSSGDTAQGI
ncbi:MAG: COP23 domain-containing protein [Pseudanabaenaceae cyanobacterium SKYGB_i_bin29]|nr:COP23 domain-containing protein [Pseudanabaenaceae cyanobacterium SKYG29]MDW8421045.1 COP23 domain-containing protein [Pseudanabaenaceae cyanobacterium SKYGB_i_bin29]